MDYFQFSAFSSPDLGARAITVPLDLHDHEHPHDDPLPLSQPSLSPPPPPPSSLPLPLPLPLSDPLSISSFTSLPASPIPRLVRASSLPFLPTAPIPAPNRPFAPTSTNNATITTSTPGTATVRPLDAFLTSPTAGPYRLTAAAAADVTMSPGAGGHALGHPNLVQGVLRNGPPPPIQYCAPKDLAAMPSPRSAKYSLVAARAPNLSSAVGPSEVIPSDLPYSMHHSGKRKPSFSSSSLPSCISMSSSLDGGEFEGNNLFPDDANDMPPTPKRSRPVVDSLGLVVNNTTRSRRNTNSLLSNTPASRRPGSQEVTNPHVTTTTTSTHQEPITIDDELGNRHIKLHINPTTTNNLPRTPSSSRSRLTGSRTPGRDNGGTPAPSALDEAEYAKLARPDLSPRAKRQLRNKLSAKNFRMRKKAYLSSLENRVRLLENFIVQYSNYVIHGGIPPLPLPNSLREGWPQSIPLPEIPQGNDPTTAIDTAANIAHLTPMIHLNPTMSMSFMGHDTGAHGHSVIWPIPTSTCPLTDNFASPSPPQELAYHAILPSGTGHDGELNTNLSHPISSMTTTLSSARSMEAALTNSTACTLPGLIPIPGSVGGGQEEEEEEEGGEEEGEEGEEEEEEEGGNDDDPDGSITGSMVMSRSCSPTTTLFGSLGVYIPMPGGQVHDADKHVHVGVHSSGGSSMMMLSSTPPPPPAPRRSLRSTKVPNSASR